MGWEVTDDVGGVAPPERECTFFSIDARESVADPFVRLGKSALFDLFEGLEQNKEAYVGTDHFILILNQELDTLDGSSRGLSNSL